MTSRLNRYQAFQQALDRRGSKGQPYTRGVRPIERHRDEEAAPLNENSYWDDKQGLKSVLTLHIEQLLGLDTLLTVLADDLHLRETGSYL